MTNLTDRLKTIHDTLLRQHCDCPDCRTALDAFYIPCKCVDGKVGVHSGVGVESGSTAPTRPCPFLDLHRCETCDDTGRVDGPEGSDYRPPCPWGPPYYGSRHGQIPIWRVVEEMRKSIACPKDSLDGCEHLDDSSILALLEGETSKIGS